MSADLEALMEADAEAPALPNETQLKDLEHLLAVRDRWTRYTEDLEEKHKQATATIRELEGKLIPEILIQANLKKIVTRDGREVSWSTAYYGRADSPEALDWMRSNGHGGLIKQEYKVPLGAGNDGLSKELRRWLDNNGFSYESKEYVHPSTLKAWLKEQVEAGRPLPTETLHIHTEYTTRIRSPRAKEMK